MKKIYFYLISILTFSSCQFQANNTNPIAVAEEIHKGLVNNDNKILKRVFKYQMDSFSNKSIKKLRKAKRFFNKNKKIKIFKIDTFESRINEKNINIIYKKDNKFYLISTSYETDSTNVIKPKNFDFLYINRLCKEEKEKPYRPFGVTFPRLSWETDYTQKTFKSGTIYLHNETNYDINYVKFRIILKHGKKVKNSETFFSQTIESYKPIYKGDIVKIQIPEMTDFFTGFIINEKELFYQPELIEAKPNPYAMSWCIWLDELKKEAINNSKKR